MGTTPFQETQNNVIDQEAPFAFDELFFSLTDDNGIILHGNRVFQRISQYSWEELVNKPHKIIRHPDMPRAVFWLLWDMIKKGRPIGAYVKNRAKDGRYYWVYAIVTPVDNGYLSVRLKPSSPIKDIVEREYKSLLNIEKEQKLAPEKSAGLLLKRLSELGFRDYGHFMSVALTKEVLSRCDHLGNEPPKAISCYEELHDSAQKLIEQSGGIFEAYKHNEYVPINLQVQSARLGENGAAIGIISGNYNLISDEIKRNVDKFMRSVREVVHTINNGMFLTGTAKIQEEVLEFFQQEQTDEDVSHQKEMQYLRTQKDTYNQKAVEGLEIIMMEAGKFRKECTEMKKLAASLEVTRVMGKVESSRLKIVQEGLNELIEELESFQASISEGLSVIDTMNQSIQHKTEILLGAIGGVKYA